MPTMRARFELFTQRLSAGNYKAALADLPPRMAVNLAVQAERGLLPGRITAEDIAAGEAANDALTRLIANRQIKPAHILEELYLETRNDLTALRTSFTALQEQFDAAPKLTEITELRLAKEAAEANLGTATAQLGELEKTLASLTEQNDVLAGEKERLEGELAASRQDLGGVRKELSKKESELAGLILKDRELQGKKEAAEALARELTAKLAAADKKIASSPKPAELASLQAGKKELATKLAQSSALAEELERDLSAQTERINVLTGEKDTLAAAQKELAARIEELERALSALTRQKEALAGEKESAESTLKTSRAELTAAEQTMGKNQIDLRRLRVDAEKAQQKYETADALAKELKTKLSSANEELTAARAAKAEADRKLIHTDSQLHLVSTRLGNSNKGALAQKKAIQAARTTAREEVSKAKAAQAAAEKKLEALERQLAEKARHLESALEQKRAAREEKAQLTAQLAAAAKEIEALSNRPTIEQHDQLAKELSRLSEQVDEAQRLVSEATVQRIELRRQGDETIAELNRSAEEETARLRGEIEGLEAIISEQEQFIAELNERLADSAEQDPAAISRQLGETSDALLDTKALKSAAEERITQLEADLDQAKELHQQALDDAAQRATNAELAQQQAEEKLQTAAEDYLAKLEVLTTALADTTPNSEVAALREELAKLRALYKHATALARFDEQGEMVGHNENIDTLRFVALLGELEIIYDSLADSELASDPDKLTSVKKGIKQLQTAAEKINLEISVLQAAVEKAATAIPMLAGVMPELAPWVAKVMAELPIIDSQQEVREHTFRQTAGLIPQLLVLRGEDRDELFRHLERIKQLGTPALVATSQLFDNNFAFLSPAAQAETIKYLKQLIQLQQAGAWGEQSLQEYAAITERLPQIANPVRQNLIRAITPENIDRTAEFLGYPDNDREEAIAYLEDMRRLTKEQVLAPKSLLRDQLRFLAVPISPAVRQEVIEEYLGGKDDKRTEKAVKEIAKLQNDPDPTVKKGANLVLQEKQLRDNLVKLVKCQDQAVRTGIINLYINLDAQHPALRRISALRDHSNQEITKGAEIIYYLWVRNTVVNLTYLQGRDSKSYQDSLADLSRIEGLAKDLWAIIINENEKPENGQQRIENTNVKLKDAANQVYLGLQAGYPRSKAFVKRAKAGQ